MHLPKIHIIEHAWMWRDLGLSLAECRVYAFLYALTRAGKGWSLSATELAENLGMSKSLACRILTDLSLRALVTKRDDMWIAVRPTTVQNMDESVQNMDENVQNMDEIVQDMDAPQSLRDFARDNKEIEENKEVGVINNNSTTTSLSSSCCLPQPDDSGFGDWWLAFASPRSEFKVRAQQEWAKLTDDERAKVMHHTRNTPPTNRDKPNWYLHDRLWDVTEQVQPPTYYDGIAIDNALREGVHLVQVRVQTEQGIRFKITSLADAQRHNLQITNPNYR